MQKILTRPRIVRSTHCRESSKKHAHPDAAHFLKERILCTIFPSKKLRKVSFALMYHSRLSISKVSKVSHTRLSRYESKDQLHVIVIKLKFHVTQGSRSRKPTFNAAVNTRRDVTLNAVIGNYLVEDPFRKLSSNRGIDLLHDVDTVELNIKIRCEA